MWPLNSGITSGSFPLSSSGMTAKEPPPPDSQLTERYFGLTYIAQAHVLISAAIPLFLGYVRVVAWKEVGGPRWMCSHRRVGLVTGRGEGYLYEVGIPGILADVEVIVAVLLPRRLAIDVS